MDNLQGVFDRLSPGLSPHQWQAQLGACNSIQDRLIRIPTGMGKTLGVLSTWLMHRVLNNDHSWPTRLVWCLPMRTLVEQTTAEAVKLVEKLGREDDVTIAQLMGGVDEVRWYDQPERPAILVGTQDMLLSRALNRGYAMYRAAWPRAFGLLNTDALWVMDEVQLMGVGLTTSAQLQAFFRQDQQAKTIADKPRATWWMSATLQPSWLETPETAGSVEELSGSIMQVDPGDRIGPQWEAKKSIERVAGDADGWADLILQRHRSHEADPETGRQTLVVVNRVKKACELHTAIKKALKGSEQSPDLRLVHSRFRPADRESWMSTFLSNENLHPELNRIIIATQVVEAGIDISASCMVTQIAPWPSLVQRFGRAARYGGKAEVIVLDPEHQSDKDASPYRLSELSSARSAVEQIEDVSIGSLEDFESDCTAEQISELYPFDPLHVLLRHEFEELFDTSADLSGADMDISRFIRDSDEERDIKVFWRAWDDDRPSRDLQPQPRELCSVPIVEAKPWLKKQDNSKRTFQWDYLVGDWVACESKSLRPGMIVLVHPAVGAYQKDTGFTGSKPKKNEAVAEVYHESTSGNSGLSDAAESSEDSNRSEVWKTIATHCREAAATGEAITSALRLSNRFSKIIQLSLRMHDWGKAHPAFANGTYNVAPDRSDLAKAPARAWRPRTDLYNTDESGPRRGFRHELASGLAVLEFLRGADPMHPAILGQNHEMLTACGMHLDSKASDWSQHPLARELQALSAAEFNLLLFLIIGHHGKVRASIQASPTDHDFPVHDALAGEGLPIRGVREGDEMPPLLLPAEDGNELTPTLTLSLTVAAMGLSPRYGSSWTERIGSLLSDFGPFTLGYLEAIVRSADGRASDESRSPGKDPDPLLADFKLSLPTETAGSSDANANHETDISEEASHA